MSVRRIYSELLPYGDLVAEAVVELLARHRLELVLAVRPWDLAGLPEVARVMRAAGVPLALWPMVDDAEGRWASARNVTSFERLVVGALDALPGERRPTEVLFDLEPPFEDAQALSHGSRGIVRIARAGAGAVLARSTYDEAREALAEVVSRVHARGVATSSAVWPLVALDPRPAIRTAPFQRLLGTPLDGLGIQRVSVMLYTTIFEGWSRGLVRRRAATRLLGRFATRARRRWGAAAGVSLGCVGTGALGDEPTYRDPAELAEDVAVAVAAGIEDLSLFDLAGVLSRPAPGAWVAAFTQLSRESAR